MTATVSTDLGSHSLTGKSMVDDVRPSARTIRRAGGLFRILVGIHFGDGPVGCRCEDCERDEMYLPDKAGQMDALREAVDTCKDVAEKASLQERLRWVVSRRDRARNHVYRARRTQSVRDAKGQVSEPDPLDYTGDLIESPHNNLETMNQPGSHKFERVHEGNTPSMLGPITPEELARRGYSGQLPQGSNQSSPTGAVGNLAPSASSPFASPKIGNGNGGDAAKSAALSKMPAQPAPSKPVDVDTMSTKALQELAESEEVDLSKCKTRDEMVKTMKAALGGGK